MKKILSLLLVLCMVAVMLPFAAFAADGDPYVQVRFDHGGTKHWNTKTYAGDATKYAVTAEDGAISAGSEDNWNVKLEYPAVGQAVLTLKGATFKYADAAGDFPFFISGTDSLTIKVEADSSITAAGRTAMYLSFSAADITVTITGPGKLSLINDNGDGAGMTFNSTKTFDCGQLIFKDANVEIKPNATTTTRYGIAFTSQKPLVIDNSKINIVCGSQCMGIAGLGLVDGNGSGGINKISTYWTSKGTNGGEDISRDIIIQNGSVITGSNTSREFFACTGTITIKDSTIDVATTAKSSNDKVFNKKPTIEGEFTAAGGSSAEKMVEYAPGKSTTYKVVKIVPGTVDLGTLGVVTTAPTEAPTVPETEPTTEATVPVENTEATVPETTVGTNNDAGNNNAGNDVENTEAADVDTDAVEEEGGLPGGLIALIIVAGVLVLAIAAFAILWFVVKPKWLMGLLKR